jgi:hypothetical protein
VFRASAEFPCPVCQSGSKGCSATADGLHLCRGEPADPGWVQLASPDGDGFRHYRRDRPLADGRRRAKVAATASPPSSASPPPARPKRDWAGVAEQCRQEMRPQHRAELATALGLPEEVFESLGVGLVAIVSVRPVFGFPEVDAAGTVIGINERSPDGSKKLLFGEHRGLSLPAGWADRPGVRSRGGVGHAGDDGGRVGVRRPAEQHRRGGSTQGYRTMKG